MTGPEALIGRNARFAEVLQRRLTLEPFEQEESMDPKRPHRKHGYEGHHVSAV